MFLSFFSYTFAHPQAISIAALLELEPLKMNDYEYPYWSVVIGWFITLSSLLCVPAYAFYHFVNTPGDTFEQRWTNAFRPPLIVNTRQLRSNGNAGPSNTGRITGTTTSVTVPFQTTFPNDTLLSNDPLPVVCLTESTHPGPGERV